jgi:hypothetical protein
MRASSSVGKNHRRGIGSYGIKPANVYFGCPAISHVGEIFFLIERNDITYPFDCRL